MTIEEIKAKEDITVGELEAEIERLENLIFYAEMSDNYNARKIAEHRNNIKAIEQMIERLKNA